MGLLVRVETVSLQPNNVQREGDTSEGLHVLTLFPAGLSPSTTLTSLNIILCSRCPPHKLL
jgi:hypothetical protein